MDSVSIAHGAQARPMKRTRGSGPFPVCSNAALAAPSALRASPELVQGSCGHSNNGTTCADHTRRRKRRRRCRIRRPVGCKSYQPSVPRHGPHPLRVGPSARRCLLSFVAVALAHLSAIALPHQSVQERVPSSTFANFKCALTFTTWTPSMSSSLCHASRQRSAPSRVAAQHHALPLATPSTTSLLSQFGGESRAALEAQL